MPCPVSKERFRRASIEKDNKKYIYTRRLTTYAKIACGCFTALRKRAAFTAASSRLVAAAEALDFFGRLPKKVNAARRFCAPPRAAGAADGPVP